MENSFADAMFEGKPKLSGLFMAGLASVPCSVSFANLHCHACLRDEVEDRIWLRAITTIDVCIRTV